MDVETLEQRCSKLRQKLKEWETSFAASNDGQKPSREDVKQNLKIAQRYKEYNKLRQSLAKGEAEKVTPSKRKRHYAMQLGTPTRTRTPNKQANVLPASHPAVVDPYDPPISFLLSPGQQDSCFAPTPQKDGQVLGIFDTLSNMSAARTPNRRRALADRATNVEMTPSKRSSLVKPSVGKEGLRRTQSLATFDVKTTPTVQRIAKSCTPGSRTSVRKLRFDDTPVFLRRESQHALGREDSEATQREQCWSPFASRMRSERLGRSLSAMVKGLRDMEDEYLDDELAIMREMEDDAPTNRLPKPPTVQVEDSQIPDLPLGPDRALHSDEDSQDDGGENVLGKPLRTWKKKGQKRTTRRVNMKPITTKWQPEPQWKPTGEDSTESAKYNPAATSSNGPRTEQGSHEGEFQTDGDVGPSKHKRGRPKSKKSDEHQSSRPKKKVSATAHANFRALNIRNKNSKGRGGKFRRRRG